MSRILRTPWILLLIAALGAAAESWDAVRALQPGANVWVLESAGQEHRGKLVTVSADSISIETGHGQVAIERTRVRRVWTRAPSRRLRNAAIGAGVGAAVGLIADQTLGVYLRNETGESGGARAVTYVAPIALFGAIGAAIPSRRTVYKAK